MANLRGLMKAKHKENQATAWNFSKYAPHQVKQALVEQNYDSAMRGISNAIIGGEPWALRLFFEAAGAIGAHGQIHVHLVQQLGARDDEHLRQLVTAGHKMERLKADASSSLEEYRDDAVELLMTLFKEHPEWRPPVVKRLSSGATEVNGHDPATD